MGTHRNPNYGEKEKNTPKPHRPPKSKEAKENWNKYNAKSEKDQVVV